MKAIILKELRACAVGAAASFAATLLLGAAMVETINGQPLNENFAAANGCSAYEIWIIATSLLSATLLGWFQTAPELRRDRWAFLLHRPTFPAAIWVAKALAGCGLWLGAQWLALACVTAWLCQPGQFPGPFDARFALPAALGALSALPAYFAAQVVALRPARWWGSKALPALWALVGAVCCYAADSVWSELALIALFTVVPAAASLGAFTARGDYDGLPRWARSVTGLLLYVGCGLAALLPAALVVSRIESAGRQAQTLAMYGVNRYGRLVLDRSPAATTDAAGRPLAGPAGDMVAQLGNFLPTLSATPLQPYAPNFHEYTTYFDTLAQQRPRYYYDHAARVVRSYQERGERWYPAAIIGVRSGSARTPAQAGPIGDGAYRGEIVSTNNSMFGGGLLFAGAIYSSPYSGLPLARMIPAPAGAAFHDAIWGIVALGRSGRGDYYSDEFVTYATAGRAIYAYDSRKKPILATSYAEDAASYPSVGITRLGRKGAFYALYQTEGMQTPEQARARPWRLMRIDPISGAATLVDSTPVPAQWISSPDQPAAGAVALPLAVAGLLAAAQLATPGPGNRDVSINLGEGSDASRHALAVVVAYALLGGALSALLLAALAPRYAWNRRAAALWMLAGLLLSWPAVLMALAMIPFPPRYACPNCHRPRLAARELCEHCGAPAPRPAPRDTDILEAVGAR